MSEIEDDTSERIALVGGIGVASSSSTVDRWLELLDFDGQVIEDDIILANHCDLNCETQSAETERKRQGAQPDIRGALSLPYKHQTSAMLNIEDYYSNIMAVDAFQNFVDDGSSHSLLLEGWRTATWPRFTLYAAASLAEWQECEGKVMLTWFATYHDRDSVQTMLKSLLGQIIRALHKNVDLPEPERFVLGRDMDRIESLLQLFRHLVENQLEWKPVFVVIEGIEQYQLPGADARKPELDKLLNCLSSMIDADTVQNPRHQPLKVLLTAHNKFIGTYEFTANRCTRLDVRTVVKEWKMPTFQ